MILPTTVPYTQLPADQIGIQPPHHLVPGDVQIGAVNLQISDLDRSLDFYTRVIGFSVHSLGEREGQRYAMLSVPGGQVLLELREKPGARSVHHQARLGLYHFAVLLPTRADLGRFIRHAFALGVRVGQSDHHFSEATYLVDPDGLSIEVYRDRSRDAWNTTEDGEIIGGSDPLNLSALNEAAGDTPWNGLPVGTTLGHMHFYVGDLEQAARFYHKGLGFPKVTWSWPGALFLGAGGYHHHIGLNTWAAGSKPSGKDDARLLSWDLILPDEDAIDATIQSLEQAGFSVTPVVSGVLASDPWGITVRFRTNTVTEESAM